MAISGYKTVKHHPPVQVQGAVLASLASALSALFPGITPGKAVQMLVWRDEASEKNPEGNGKVMARAAEVVTLSDQDLQDAIAAGEAPSIFDVVV